jgi:hypothetical protein
MVRLGEVIVRGPSVHEPANVLARAVDGDDHAACVSGTIGCQKDGHVGYFTWSRLSHRSRWGKRDETKARCHFSLHVDI